MKSKVVVKIHFYMWGKCSTSLDRPKNSPARPSVRSSKKMKMYAEDIRMVTVLARNRGRRILISH